MAVIDLTEDINAQIRLSRSIGQGIGSFFRIQREKEKAEEARELKKIQQQETLRIMAGEGTPEEKLRLLNQMPGAVNSKFVQRMNEKAVEKQLMSGNQPASVKIAELEKLQKIYEKTQTFDPITGESTTLPGMEVVAQGTQARIRELSKELFGVESFVPPPPAGEPRPEPSTSGKVATGIGKTLGLEGSKRLRGVQEAGPEGTIGEFIEQQRQLREGVPTQANIVTGGTKKELDDDEATARAILQEAGGDKARAREIARERGFQF
jgi:hypothetical protein